jgi:hypothetical protein
MMRKAYLALAAAVLNIPVARGRRHAQPVDQEHGNVRLEEL